MRQYDDPSEYYRLRETRERQMAEYAPNEMVRSIHLALADNYMAAAEEAEKRNLDSQSRHGKTSGL